MLFFLISLAGLYVFFSFSSWLLLRKNLKLTKSTFIKKLKMFLISQAFILTFMFIGFFLYAQVGKFDELYLTEKINSLIKKADFTSAQKILQEKLSKNQSNMTALLLLTEVAPKNKDYKLAIYAYEKIIQQEGKTSDLLANLAQIKYLQNEQKTTAEIAAILAESLKLNAENPLALTLAGMHQYELKNWQKAQNYWSLALLYVADDSLDAQILTSALKNVAEKLNRQIKVRVDLSNSLKKHLKRQSFIDARLLVFIKKQDNSQPLEVVKIDPDKLPTQVLLTHPKSAKNLEVFALLSVTAKADGEHMDYFASKKIHPQFNSLQITISKKAL